jgi:MOSC domain-containing protein YiiM
MPTIFSIVHHPLDRQYENRDGDYIRVPLQEAQLLEGHGIDGDQKAGHHPDRQLNLLSKEWLEAVHPKGYHTEPGQFGEQIILEGVAVEALEPGARLQLGRAAVIEITKLRTGCERLEAAQGQSIRGLGPLGALARVISGGAIRVGDGVLVLEPAADAGDSQAS